MDNIKRDVNNDDLTSKAVNPGELVSYQTGSIVSRVILKKETGNITIFAFDKGQGLSEHTAPFDAHIYVLEGEVDITISQKEFNVKSGEMIILPANKPHAVHAATKFKMVLTMIR